MLAREITTVMTSGASLNSGIKGDISSMRYHGENVLKKMLRVGISKGMKMTIAMGFKGRDKVFHSIRETVGTLFEQAEVLEGIAADILGYEKQAITYGLYSEGLARSKNWMLDTS